MNRSKWLNSFIILTLSTLLSVSAEAARIYALTTGNQLRLINSSSPGTVIQTVTITGLQAGENVEAIDFRPATGQLFALGSTSRLYSINTGTGAATQVGSAGAFTLNGTSFGFDINPTVDRIRVVSDSDQNIRLNPLNGTLTATDTPLAYSGSDIHFGSNPTIVGCAYSNSVAGTTTTTLFGIDSGFNTLVIHNPPNNGTLNTVGSLGVDASSVCGFDIWDFDNTAFAAMAIPGDTTSGLYTINLATGAATLIGTIGGGGLIKDIATVPSGSISFSSALYWAPEQATNFPITISRVGGSYGGMTISYSTTARTATAGVDYQSSSGIITFADGDTTKTFTVPIFEDSIPELNEIVALTLSVAPGDGVISGTTTSVLEIVSTQNYPVYLLSVSNKLMRFSTTPSAIETSISITGLQTGETIKAIDFRPATGQLFGLGSSNRLYIINTNNGGAVQVGSAGSFVLFGTNFGFDFNPTVDRIRVVSDLDQNLRLNPNDSIPIVDTTLTYNGGDSNSIANPNLIASAYIKNYAGATSTTLYGIDSALDLLVTQNPPNAGILNSVGSLGIDITPIGDFDYTEADQSAYAVLNRVGSLSEIYKIDLTTGAAALLGAVNSSETIQGIAIVDAAPVLQIQKSGTNALVSWTAASLNYYLESNTNLSTANWISNAVTPAIINDRKVVTNGISGNRLFRLKR